MAEERSYMTAQEMAAKYKITPETVRRRVLDGAWPCDRIGRLYRFSPSQQDEIAQLIAVPTSGFRWTRERQTEVAEALRKLTGR